MHTQILMKTSKYVHIIKSNLRQGLHATAQLYKATQKQVCPLDMRALCTTAI